MWVRGAALAVAVVISVAGSPLAAASSSTDIFSQPWNRVAAPITSIDARRLPAALAGRIPTQAQVARPTGVVQVVPRRVTESPRQTCELPVADPRLGSPVVRVVDERTGQTLSEVDAQHPVTTASTAKIVTGAVVLRALGSQTRLRTTVTTDATPGQVVLVGAGDVTLSAQDSNWYGTPNGIAQLAGQVRDWSARSGIPVTSVAVDAGLFTGSSWAPSWKSEYFTSGSQSQISALTLDGGRAHPEQEYSQRVGDPAQAAGQALAAALGVTTDAISTASSAGRPVIAAVESPTIADQVGFMLRHSDNTLADTLGRLAAGAAGKPRGFDSLTAAYGVWLQRLGATLDGSVFADASGLSHDTKVAPQLITSLLRLSASDGQASGVWGLLARGDDATSTLEHRFGGLSDQQRHDIRAKTGTLEDVTSLAGTIPNAKGHLLVFFIGVEGPTNSAVVRQGIDAFVARLAACTN